MWKEGFKLSLSILSERVSSIRSSVLSNTLYVRCQALFSERKRLYIWMSFFLFLFKEIFLWCDLWSGLNIRPSVPEDLPKCTSSSPRHESYFLPSRTCTNIRLWWIGQSNNGGTLIQNWYKDISLVTIWSRSSRGCWQEAFWHSLQAIWGALIESTATISQQWISALKEVAGVRCGGSRDWNKEINSTKWSEWTS